MLRTSLSAAALAAALLVTSAAQPPVASADRCNPDEVLRMVDPNYQPVFGEDDGPFCYVMNEAVYPALGCADVSLQACVTAQPGRAAGITRGTCAEVNEAKNDRLGYHPATANIPCHLIPG